MLKNTELEEDENSQIRGHESPCDFNQANNRCLKCNNSKKNFKLNQITGRCIKKKNEKNDKKKKNGKKKINKRKV